MCNVSLGEETELLFCEESHVGSCRGLGGDLTSDAVETCRLRRTGSHLPTVGGAGALSSIDLRCCVHASLPMLGSLSFASVPRHCRIYWREKSEATRVLGELHEASVSSPRTQIENAVLCFVSALEIRQRIHQILSGYS